MKRFIRLIVLLLAAALACEGICMAEEPAFCITGCEDFHDNLQEFYTQHMSLLEQTVLIEGYLYVGDAPELERDNYYYVYHWHESCCDDGLMRDGMEVVWLTDDGVYPEAESYVRAVGVLRIYEDHGYKLIRIELESIESIEDPCQ